MSLHAKEAHPGWRRRRHWFMPRPHRLLQACSCDAVHSRSAGMVMCFLCMAVAVPQPGGNTWVGFLLVVPCDAGT